MWIWRFGGHFIQIYAPTSSHFFQNIIVIFKKNYRNSSQFFDTCFASRILLFSFPRCEFGALVGILFKYMHQNLLKFFSKYCRTPPKLFSFFSQIFDTCFATRNLLFRFPRCESGALVGILFKYAPKSSHFFLKIFL